MTRADVKCKMRGYSIRQQNQTFFRKRITPLREFGTFGVIVCVASAAGFAVLRLRISSVDNLHLPGPQHGLFGHYRLHVHRGSDIGTGLVIRNCNAFFILGKSLALILNFPVVTT